MTLFRPETSFWSKVRNVVAGFGLMVMWSIFIQSLLYMITGEKIYQDGDDDFKTFLPLFILTCIVPPLWEELKYRVIYLKLSKFMDNLFEADNKIVMLGIALSAIDFGWGHGGGIYSLLMQGVMGFILAGVYIKNGYSYWSSVTLHFLWNLFVTFGIKFL